MRILKPGGTAILSDCILAGECAKQFRELGCVIEKRRGTLLIAFARLALILAPQTDVTFQHGRFVSPIKS